MLPFIDVPFIFLSRKLGAGPDEIKLLFSFLLSYPLAGVLKRIPDAHPERKNAFIVGVGLFYLVGLFDLWAGVWTLFISAAGTYAIAAFFRRSPYMPWMGFVLLMGHLSVNHIARMVQNDPSVVDITFAQMVMVMKLSAFCWNVADGTLPEDQLSDLQKDRMLRELPNPLDFAAYVLFFPSLMAGPAFDYAEYRRWIDTSMFDLPPQTDPAKRPPTRRKRRIPRSGTPAMLKAGQGLLWVGLFLALSGSFSYTFLLGDSYMKLGFLRRLFTLHMVGVTARVKYYGVWAITEGACVLTGLGYNGIDPVTGRVLWNRLQNVDAWGVETAQNARTYLDSWNMNTNKWLRNYIYLRVTPRGKKPGFRATMATFITSAFWHGFNPGYYLTFGLSGFMLTVARDCRRYFRPFFLDPVTHKPTGNKKFYDALSIVTTQLAFSFATCPFLILSLGGSLLVWARVYFYAIIGTAAGFALFASPAKPRLRRILEERAARAAGRGVGSGSGGQQQQPQSQSQEGEKDKRQAMSRTVSNDSVRGTVLGLPTDPEKDLQEAVEEIRREMEARQQQQKSGKGVSAAASGVAAGAKKVN